MNWEDRLDKELRFHLEQHTADLIAQGHTPDAARRIARIALGGPDQVKEGCRDERPARWLADFWQDVRYAVRSLRQRPGFTAVALGTLALGIGATTVMFTLINGVLLKPLPYSDPGRLIQVAGHTAQYGNQNFAYPDYLDLRREIQSLGPLAGWVYNWGTLSQPGDPENVEVREVTADLFPVLGAKMLRGRGFLPEEDAPGGRPVAILGYSLWQRKFAGSAEAIDAPVVLDGTRYTVVGIARPEMRLEGEPDVFTPLGQDPAAYLRNRRAHPVGVLGRLRPGVTLAQAQSEVAVLAGRLSAQYPESNKDRAFVADRLRADVGDVQSTLWLLLGAVTLVLLIACVNVASLLLAKAVARERELAMRMALGAGRWRLVRQCLTESAVLGFAGGVVGVVLAAVGIRPFVAFWPGSLPRAEEVQLDWRVLLFAVAASLVSGILFGLAPALRAPVRQLEQALRSGGRAVAGSPRRLHGGFVAAEIALAVVLLVAAGMLGRTLMNLAALEPGVNLHNVLVARMRLAPSTVSSPAAMRAAWQSALDEARRVPGVQAAATVDTVPMRQGNNQLGYWTSAAMPEARQLPLALATSVTPDYLKVMGIALQHGRFFDEHDRLDSELVVAIDDVMAKQAFRGDDPIGKRLWIPDMSAGPVRVVGVVGHVRHWGLAGDDQAKVRAQVYYPFAQVPDRLVRRWSELMSVAVRTNVPPLGVVEPLRRAVRGAGGDQVLYQVRTMEQLAQSSIGRQRFLMLLFGIFAMLALALASIGIYGVLAYLTRQRVPEIGMRMALGATSRDVIGMVLRQSLGMIAAGVVVGLAAALAMRRVLERLVEGMRPMDPVTVALMIGVLVAAALAASFVPALRASRVDPMAALRAER
uniref:Permease n=1 Tax=Solibacter usitatus (strain Ellin6076) TaxID=234267 RepID=Q01ZV8_SOLUE